MIPEAGKSRLSASGWIRNDPIEIQIVHRTVKRKIYVNDAKTMQYSFTDVRHLLFRRFCSIGGADQQHYVQNADD